MAISRTFHSRAVCGETRTASLTSPLQALYQGVWGFFLAISMVFALLCSMPAKAQEESPLAKVETVVNELLGILRQPDFNLERDRETIKSKILAAFDSTAMAQSVLSTGWRQATPEQQATFRDLLVQIIEGTYLDRIQAYTNESVEFRNEAIDGNRATVNTVVITKSGQIPVTYKLRKRSEGWFVYDVEIENVSMVSTYRQTYQSILNREGLDGLLDQMRARVEQLKTAPPAAAA